MLSVQYLFEENWEDAVGIVTASLKQYRRHQAMTNIENTHK